MARWGSSTKRCREFSSFFVRKTASIWGRAGAAPFMLLAAPADESYSNSVDALSVLKPGMDCAADRVVVMALRA